MHLHIGLRVEIQLDGKIIALHHHRGAADIKSVAGAQGNLLHAHAAQLGQVQHGAHEPVPAKAQIPKPHAVGAGAVELEPGLQLHKGHGIHRVAHIQRHQIGHGGAAAVGQVDHVAVKIAALVAVVLVKQKGLRIHPGQGQPHRLRQFAGRADGFQHPDALTGCGQVRRHIIVLVERIHIQHIHIQGEKILRLCPRHGAARQQAAEERQHHGLFPNPVSHSRLVLSSLGAEDPASSARRNSLRLW